MSQNLKEENLSKRGFLKTVFELSLNTDNKTDNDYKSIPIYILTNLKNKKLD